MSPLTILYPAKKLFVLRAVLPSFCSKLILIDLLNEKIITQINFNKSEEWKIE